MEKAIAMKGERIRIRYVGDSDIKNLTKGKVYSAIHDGVGHVENALFKELVADDGSVYSGQLNGYDGFRMLLCPNVTLAT